MHVAEAGHANDLGDELQQCRAWKPLGVTQSMQRCVASTKSRTCCFPGGSDFTTQNGAARNVKGLLHHKCSSQQWPVVPFLFVGCLPAMHSLPFAAACLSLSSGGISVGRSISTGAGATCVFVTLTDWANPALRLRVPRYVNAHVLPLHLILEFHVLFCHVCGGRREFRNPSVSARSDRLSYLFRDALLQNSVWGKRKGHSNDVVASRISVLCK